MPGMSPGTALRQLQQAQAGLKKARQLLKQAKDRPAATADRIRGRLGEPDPGARLMAAIPLAAADEAVLTKQLAVQRYATALLVRLRRLTRDERDRSGGALRRRRSVRRRRCED